MAEELITKYFINSQRIFTKMPIEKVLQLFKAINQVRINNSTVFIAGNGGSASTATHFATDIGIGSLNRSNPVRALSLCDNSAVLTAISNDLKYSSIFEEQLKLLGKKGDLLLVISASGNSVNLINALELATKIGIETYSLTGFDGGKIKELTIDRNVHIETTKGEYGLVEDAHLAICHVITECIRSI